MKRGFNHAMCTLYACIEWCSRRKTASATKAVNVLSLVWDLIRKTAAMMAQFILLFSCIWLMSSRSEAQEQHELAMVQSNLWRHGLSILQTLNLHPAEMSFKGKVFNLPMLSWSFRKQEKLENMLQTLAQKNHPFQYLDVLNGLFLLQADLPRAKVLMLLQADGREAYSGHLSLIAQVEPLNFGQTAETNLGAQEPLLRWLSQEAQVLMDVEALSDEKNRLQRQWVFLVPHEAQFLQASIRQQLAKSAWLEQSNLGLALNQWHKDEQVIHYYVDTVEHNTTLYLSYSSPVRGDL